MSSPHGIQALPKRAIRLQHPLVDRAAHPDRHAAGLQRLGHAVDVLEASGTRRRRATAAGRATALCTPRGLSSSSAPRPSKDEARRPRTPRAASRRRCRGRGGRRTARRGWRPSSRARSAGAARPAGLRCRGARSWSCRRRTDSTVIGSSQWPSGPVGCLEPRMPPTSGLPYSSRCSPNDDVVGDGDPVDAGARPRRRARSNMCCQPPGVLRSEVDQVQGQGGFTEVTTPVLPADGVICRITA